MWAWGRGAFPGSCPPCRGPGTHMPPGAQLCLEILMALGLFCFLHPHPRPLCPQVLPQSFILGQGPGGRQEPQPRTATGKGPRHMGGGGPPTAWGSRPGCLARLPVSRGDGAACQRVGERWWMAPRPGMPHPEHFPDMAPGIRTEMPGPLDRSCLQTRKSRQLASPSLSLCCLCSGIGKACLFNSWTKALKTMHLWFLMSNDFIIIVWIIRSEDDDDDGGAEHSPDSNCGSYVFHVSPHCTLIS